jgi:hypothetical protein
MDHGDREGLDRAEDLYWSGASSSPSAGSEPSASVRRPLGESRVSSEVAENAFAAFTKESLSDIIQKAKGFYARHPTLVKTLGTLAAAAIARRLFRGRPGLL